MNHPHKPAAAYRLAILRNECPEDHLGWEAACRDSKYDIDYTVLDLTREDWLEGVLSEAFDMYLTRPPGAVSFFKQLYDERIYILAHVLNKPIYPTCEEVLLYENKRMQAYWLKANRVPHPRTWIFYHESEARKFARDCSLPVVAKTAVGASGAGVRILRSPADVDAYIRAAFSPKGIKRKWGPNLRKGDIGKRARDRLKNIPRFLAYMKEKRAASVLDPQRWFVIFQEYVPADFEWRCVRIGESYFGHKKIARRGQLKSGTSDVAWDAPPGRLLDFVREVTDRRGFLSQAVDLFEPEPGRFLVNELHCFWGSKNPHQMSVKGIPGRYILEGGRWAFQEGNFNTNDSYDLRLRHAVGILESG